MKTRTYNPKCSIERQRIADLIAEGNTVVCAFRPVPGSASWIGESCYGRHWAYGNISQFEQAWTQLDAANISLISNQELLVAAKNHYFQYKNTRSNTDLDSIESQWKEFCIDKDDSQIVGMILKDANWLH